MTPNKIAGVQALFVISTCTQQVKRVYKVARSFDAATLYDVSRLRWPIHGRRESAVLCFFFFTCCDLCLIMVSEICAS